MYSKAILLTALFVAASSISSSNLAAESAHEHGVGELNVALEAGELIIELEAPGSDIVGFEHAPTTDHDKQTVHNAVLKLKKGLAVFQPAASAACRLDDVDVHSELMAHSAGQTDEQDHQDHSQKDHGEHGKQDLGHEQDKNVHAEFRVFYRYICSSPAKLTHLDLGYFKMFPGARELDARIITSRGQSAQELTPDSPRLKF